MAGSLANSGRSQLAIKLEGVYPTNFGVVQAGNGTVIARVTDNLSGDLTFVESKTLRSDRQIAGMSQTDIAVQGSIDIEHIYKEYDPLLQNVLQQDYTVYGTNGVSGNVAITPSATTFTAGAAPTGNDAWTNLQKGQWFKLIPPPGASQAVKDYLKYQPFRVSLSTAPTTTVITVDATTPINTAIVGTSSITNCNIATSFAVNGSTIKTYSVEVGHLDIGQYRQYLGMVTGKFSLKLDPAAIVTGSFEFMGKNHVLLQASGMGTPTASQTFTPANATKGVFDIIENGATLSTLTYLKSGEFTIDNTLRDQNAVGVFGCAGIGVGTLRCTGKMSVYFAEASMYQRVLNATTSSLALPILDKDGNGYVYFFPNITYTAVKPETGGTDADSMLNIDWTASVDNSTGNAWSGKTVVIYRVGL